MAMDEFLFKELLPSIMVSKRSVINDDQDEKRYNTYLVNKALSLHNDLIFIAQQMNQLYHLPRRTQYQYLLGAVRPMKRGFKQWPKKQNNADVKLLMRHFEYSQQKATIALQLLSDEQMETIRNYYEHL